MTNTSAKIEAEIDSNYAKLYHAVVDYSDPNAEVRVLIKNPVVARALGFDMSSFGNDEVVPEEIMRSLFSGELSDNALPSLLDMTALPPDQEAYLAERILERMDAGLTVPEITELDLEEFMTRGSIYDAPGRLTEIAQNGHSAAEFVKALSARANELKEAIKTEEREIFVLEGIARDMSPTDPNDPNSGYRALTWGYMHPRLLSEDTRSKLFVLGIKPKDLESFEKSFEKNGLNGLIEGAFQARLYVEEEQEFDIKGFVYGDNMLLRAAGEKNNLAIAGKIQIMESDHPRGYQWKPMDVQWAVTKNGEPSAEGWGDISMDTIDNLFD